MIGIPQVGDTILDRYRVDSIIDRKNETVIYNCTDTRLDVPGVLKLLINVASLSYSADLKERFIQSARVQARLNHPNIVHVINIESRGEYTFSVMELLYGDTLQKHIVEHQVSFSFKEVLELFIAIADALAMAHETGVLHKYLNPSNVILSQQGNRLSPRILNFSAHKVADMLNPFTALPYLSPEQFHGDENACPQSDVFSLGAMLYFVFMKQAPFIGDDYKKYLQYYQNYEALSVLPPEIPAAFASIIQKSLQKDPAKRYPSATELLKEIKSIAPTHTLSANLSIEVPQKKNGSAVRYGTNSSQILVGTGSSPAVAAGSNPSQPAMRRITRTSQPSLPTHSSSSMPAYNGRVSSVSNPALSVRASQLENPVVRPDQFALPASLLPAYDLTYRLSFDNDSRVAIVKKKQAASDQSFCVKFLQSTNPARVSAFLQGVEKQQQLAAKSPCFQSFISIYRDVPGYLVPNEARLSFKAYAETKGALDPLFVMRSFAILSEAMQIAHENQAVHAGLKPENLFLIQRQEVFYPVIFDLGQRVMTTSKSDISPTLAPYMAPELQWNLANANEQSDIFAFGMLMNFAILGASPYKKLAKKDIFSAIQGRSNAPSLLELQSDIDPNFIKVIDWCTAFDPKQRYRHFANLRRDLLAVISPYV